MKCLIFQPNNQALKVQIRSKALGQECLDKVCKELGIIETGFFGLQFLNKNGRLCWLVLQKRIDGQVVTKSAIIELYFKVKFYVMPHFIQQNATRHQFYMNICRYLQQEGRKLKIDKDKRIRLMALIAQIEFGNYDDDSYDLKCLYAKWIPVLFDELQRDPTGRLKPNVGSGHHNFVFCFTDEDLFDSKENGRQKIPHLGEPRENWTYYQQIISLHQKLKGYSQLRAEYQFLKESLEIEELGTEYFHVIANRKNIRIGIGPRGVTLNQGGEKISIPYNKLKEIHHHRTNHLLNYYFKLTITYQDENNYSTTKAFRIGSNKEADTFYRMLTERRVFYSFPMVDSTVVTANRSSDFNLLNTIARTLSPAGLKSGGTKSDMNGNKTFVFDVDRTLKQFYDDVRRFINHFNGRFDTIMMLTNPGLCIDAGSVTGSDSGDKHSYEKNPQRQQEQDQRASSVCKICLDVQIDMAFIPCGHTSCAGCGLNLKPDVCPFCKSDIDSKQKIFI